MIDWILDYQWQASLIVLYFFITIVMLFNHFILKFFKWMFKPKKKDNLPKKDSLEAHANTMLVDNKPQALPVMAKKKHFFQPSQLGASPKYKVDKEGYIDLR